MFDGTVKNMFEVGRQTVLAARKKCDVLVIVAHCEFEPALRLAKENPEADVVIAGNAETVFNLRKVGKTTVVCAAPGNTEQGDLRLYLAPDGTFKFKFRSTNLDASVPADPAAQLIPKPPAKSTTSLGRGDLHPQITQMTQMEKRRDHDFRALA